MKIKLNNVRLSYPCLYEPKAFQGEGEPKFSANFLFEAEGENHRIVVEALKAQAKESFNEDAVKKYTNLVKAGKTCLCDGSLKSFEGYEGMYYLTAKSKKRPLLIDRDKSITTKEDGIFYAGCYVNVIADVYIPKSYPGIWAELKAVQFYAHGEPIGGSSVSEDDFEAFTDEEFDSF